MTKETKKVANSLITAKNSLKEHLLNLQKKDPTKQGLSANTESLITVSDDHDALTPVAFQESVLKAILRASPKSLIAMITGSKKTLLRVESTQEQKQDWSLHPDQKRIVSQVPWTKYAFTWHFMRQRQLKSFF